MWTEIDTWIVLTGVFVAMACALPGLFLVLNRQSMLGDAISHAVLPGIAIAFLITASREPMALLPGAVLAGILTGLLTYLLEKYGRVEASAALGVVFSLLFALGLLLIRVASDRVDLDPSCVLYGTLEMSVIDDPGIPGITWLSLILFLLNGLAVLLFYKELKALSFDPDYAQTRGLPVSWLRQGLAIMTSITAVLCFEAVGSILVVAMLVVPASTALLLSRDLRWVLGGTLFFAVLTAPFGHFLAVWGVPYLLRSLVPGMENLGATSSTGMMCAVGGGFFFVVLLARQMKQRFNRQERSATHLSPGLPS